MRSPGFFKSSVLVDIVNYVGIPLLAIYCVSMFIFPWAGGEGDWKYVQRVWDRWQSLNAGALAFLASLIALNISRFNENRQREREFTAAKAFLPSALSGMMEYFSRCATIYDIFWKQSVGTPSHVDSPDIPRDCVEVFGNCIRHAPPDFGSYLSNILVRLQVHDARLRDSILQVANSSNHSIDKLTLITYVMRLGELYALVGNLFGFARNEDDFKAASLSWEDMRSAYRLLNFEIEDWLIDERLNLEELTKSWLERTNVPRQSTGK